MDDLSLINSDQCILLIGHIVLQILGLCIRVILQFRILTQCFVAFEVFNQFNNILCIHDYFSFDLTECWFNKYIHYAIAEAKPVGITVGIVL